MSAISPKPANWTEEHIFRIWDWYTTDPHTQDRYFSHMKGESLTCFLVATGQLHGNLLDFGCGQGDFLAHLLERNLSCYGADYSPEAVAKVSDRFKRHRNWRDCRLINKYRTNFATGFFDVITLVETLEHIPAVWLAPLFAELRRLVKPDGIVVITTPHNENLGKEAIYCPFCESVFHRWQHMHSFTIHSLQELVTAHGFQSIFCNNIDLDQLVLDAHLLPLRHLSLAKLAKWVLRKGRIVLDFLFPRPFPLGRSIQHCQHAGNRRHLCAVIKPTPSLEKSPPNPVQETNRSAAAPFDTRT